MNLAQMFAYQKIMDNEIVKEKGLEGQNLLPMKKLALQVALGKLANEWSGFKFWSDNRSPNCFEWWGKCEVCNGHGVNDENHTCANCAGTGDGHKNPMLEEYIDCLRFILSIGLELNETKPVSSLTLDYISELSYADKDFIAGAFSQIFRNSWNVRSGYSFLFIEFLKLGISLNFTWEQIEAAYYEKELP